MKAGEQLSKIDVIELWNKAASKFLSGAGKGADSLIGLAERFIEKHNLKVSYDEFIKEYGFNFLGLFPGEEPTVSEKIASKVKGEESPPLIEIPELKDDASSIPAITDPGKGFEDSV